MNILQEKPETLSSKGELAEGPSKPGFFALSALLLLTLIALILAGPSGNFPVNDDHLYAYAARSLSKLMFAGGDFEIAGSNAFDFIPLVTGAVVCKLAGFSFVTLRWVTIGFHLFGITGLYLALRQMKLKPLDSALLSAVYALNPFMINLSLSFMTDVPAVALTNWALFATVVALKKKQFAYWLISVLCLTASMATRQSALILLPPIYLAGLITLKDNKDRALLLSTLLIPFFTYTYLQDWLLQASMIPSGYTSFSGMAQNSILTLLCSPWKMIVSVAQGLCYVGLALMPVTLALAICGLRNKNARLYAGIAAALAVLFVAAPLASQQIQGAFMPYSLNLFMPPILGSYCLVGGVPFWRAEHLKIFTYVADIAAVATAFCVVMSVLKPAELLTGMQKSDELCRRIFLALLVACVTGGLLVQLSVSNFDRYYMVALAPLLVCLAPLWRDLNPLKLRAITVALVIAIGAYGTIATMDVMNFTRAQWQAIRQLEAQKIPAKRIDGGPIYDIYAGGLPLTQGFKQGQGWPDSMRGTPETCKLRWWPLVKDDYIIAADTVNGYHATSKLKYWSPIFWRYRTIYTLKSDKLN